MKTPARLLLPAMLLASPLTLAQAPEPAPAEAPAPAGDKLVSLRFSGPLREAVQKIASAGGLSVMLSGSVGDTPVDLFLEQVSAEEALQTLADSHGLRVSRKGRMVVLSPEGSAAAAPTPPMPPLPPMPPMPPMPGDLAEQISEDLEMARAAEEAAREAAEEMNAHVAERMAEARERMREARERMREAGRNGGRDVVARGQTLVIQEDENVDSAVVYGGNLIIKGQVEDDAVAFGGNIDVLGHVEGDVTAFGGNVTLGPDSVVEGEVSTFGGNVIRKEGSVVEGSIGSFGGESLASTIAREVSKEVGKSVKERHVSKAEEHESSSFPGKVALFLLRFAMLFGLGFLAQLFMPSRMRELGAEIRESPLRVAAVGGLGALALIPITVVLCVTIIGIPVAFVLLLATALATALAFTAVAGELGMKLPVLRGRKTQAFVLAVGLLALLLLSSIPVLGHITLALALAVALGAVIRTRFGNRPRSPFPPEPVSATASAL